jgi:hypothetical protein
LTLRKSSLISGLILICFSRERSGATSCSLDPIRPHPLTAARVSGSHPDRRRTKAKAAHPDRAPADREVIRAQNEDRPGAQNRQFKSAKGGSCARGEKIEAGTRDL